MPCGIRRSLGQVVLMAFLMPPVPASAQAVEAGRLPRGQIVADVGGSFVIRAAGPVSTQTPQAPLRLGNSIRLDRTLLAPAPRVQTQSHQGRTP